MRYTVESILEYLAGGDGFEDVLSEFPDLTRDDLLACLQFYVVAEAQKSTLCCGMKFLIDAHLPPILREVFFDAGSRGPSVVIGRGKLLTTGCFFQSSRPL
jgi:hypothetical protein